MDFGKIFSRAIRVTWQYKVLWLLGILASCMGGQSTGGQNFSFNMPSSRGSGSNGITPFYLPGSQMDWPVVAAIIGAILVLIGVIALIAIVLSLVFWVIGIVVRGALVAGVNQVEAEGGTSLNRALAGASARFTSLLGMNVLLALPVLIAGLVTALVMLLGLGTLFAQLGAADGRATREWAGAMAGIGLLATCLVPLACVGFLYNILAAILRLFSERAIVIEGQGAVEGLKRGWAVFRDNLGNSILLGIILILLGLVIGVGVALLFLPAAAPLVAGIAAAAQRSTAPGLALIAVSGVLFLLAIAASILINGFVSAFASACWTLAYREFINKPQPALASPATA